MSCYICLLRSLTPPPEYSVVEEEQYPGFRQLKITFPAYYDDTVIAYLLIPSKGQAQRLSAVVVIHGHDDGARSAIGAIESSDGQNAIARELALNGHIVIVPELRGFGEREFDFLRKGHVTFATFSWEVGIPNTTILLSEVLQCVQILKNLPEADPSRIGVAGLSLGGRLSYLTAAVDTDVKAVVSTSGLTSTLEVARGNGGALHDGIPGLLQYADYRDLAGLVAPRPMLLSWGLKENFVYWYEAHEHVTYNYIKAIYAMLGSADKLVLNTHNGGHAYDVQAVVEFFEHHL